MRILLTCHHRLHADAGAPGLTLALGRALEGLGCDVDYYGFQHAFRNDKRETLLQKLAFPWRAARFLRRRERDFDVIDATSGDAWVWASLRRRRNPQGPALFTRAHGLEHVASETVRRGGARLGWRYPLYHGGYRLWEVRRSMALADHCVLYNSIDRRYATTRLAIPERRVTVVPNAVLPHFLEAPDASRQANGPIALAFVGTWIPRKGTKELVEIVKRLLERDVDFTLAIVGSGGERDPLRDFPPEAVGKISVVPTYDNNDLPGLLKTREALIFPSHSEGFSVSLLEAMACGLVPVAAAAGSAPDVIDPRSDGLLAEVGDTGAAADAIERLASDRNALYQRRRAAQEKARTYRWERIAHDTLRLYERVLAEAAPSTSSRNAGVTASQV